MPDTPDDNSALLSVKPLGVAFVPGIRTVPGGKKGWVTRAMEFCRDRAGVRGLPLEYFTFASLKSLQQERQVRRFVDLISDTEGLQGLRVLCHSNGADIVCQGVDLLRQTTAVRIDELHLVAAAVEHDFSKNHLATALLTGRVNRVVIYASRRDGWLRWLARLTRPVLGRIGYGYLGYKAAVSPAALNVPESIRSRVTLIIEPRGHSEWLLGDSFMRIMRLVTRRPIGSPIAAPSVADFVPPSWASHGIHKGVGQAPVNGKAAPAHLEPGRCMGGSTRGRVITLQSPVDEEDGEQAGMGRYG